MTGTSPVARDFPYIFSLIICQILGIVTSGLLAFIGLGHLTSVNRLFHLEDLINFAIIIPIIGSLVAHVFGSRRTFRNAMLASTVMVTISIVFDIAGLLRAILQQQLVNPVLLLAASVAVFISIVLTFTVWYWIIDGRIDKDLSGPAAPPVLIFPQQTGGFPGYDGWVPGFTDYLFLSFHTSTTFGPTDTIVLSRTGKVVMMGQVSISLIVLIALAARAIALLR